MHVWSAFTRRPPLPLPPLPACALPLLRPKVCCCPNQFTTRCVRDTRTRATARRVASKLAALRWKIVCGGSKRGCNAVRCDVLRHRNNTDVYKHINQFCSIFYIKRGCVTVGSRCTGLAVQAIPPVQRRKAVLRAQEFARWSWRRSVRVRFQKIYKKNVHARPHGPLRWHPNWPKLP